MTRMVNSEETEVAKRSDIETYEVIKDRHNKKSLA